MTNAFALATSLVKLIWRNDDSVSCNVADSVLVKLVLTRCKSRADGEQVTLS